MRYYKYASPPAALQLTDVLFVLFRHKWKIIVCAVTGIIGAAAAYFLLPPEYESQARLMVRYVVERSAVDALDSQVKTPASQSESENLINSELAIITSSDLATQVADAVGVERILPESGGKGTTDEAARRILRHLKATALKDSNIISVSYTDRDPALAMRVLQELVTRYFDKHLEVHRSAGAFDFVKRETDQVGTQLSQTEADLKELKDRTGIVSLAEGSKTLNEELAKSQQEFDAATAELSAQKARVQQIERWLASVETNKQNNTVAQPSVELVHKYQALVARMGYLSQAETELLAKYSAANRLVKVKEAQIEDLEKQRRDLEEKFPDLIATIPVAATFQNPRPDLMSEKARLVEIQAKTDTLQSRLAGLQAQVKMVSTLGPRFAALERKKELEEANYKYFQASLEKARIDETLDPSRMPNISVVQKPSAAVRTTQNLLRIVFGLAGGGLAVGIVTAVMIELVFDRTLKRPLELETRLSIPLLLSIPDFARNGYARQRLLNGSQDALIPFEGTSGSTTSSWDSAHLFRPFCEAIRDRLVLYFELNEMTHKPKLVSVTGLSKGVGASTLAAGIAAALSETGEEKVLFVDMNNKDLNDHPFFSGRQAHSLSEVLQTRNGFDPSETENNLLFATATASPNGSQRFAAKKFYQLVPQFKASDFDYVIFDMPPLSESSAALAMACFMDKVLLVVEAEKSNRELARRAYGQLTAAKANVSTVFNKSRSYGPKWLENEI
jgi:uncharacterized protein involved in exopolysaccharide biosynthesis/Mrp family chromosome partitioning ATPase